MLSKRTVLFLGLVMLLFSCKTSPNIEIKKYSLSDYSLEFVKVEGGIFDMGCTNSFLQNLKYKKFDCQCTSSKFTEDVKIESFYISKYPITQSQFQDFVKDNNYKTTADNLGYVTLDLRTFDGMKKDTLPKNIDYDIRKLYTPYNPSDYYSYQALAKNVNWQYNPSLDSSISSTEPVIFISLSDAKDYCIWLSKKINKNIRLLSSKEWEFAARGGLYSKGYCRAGQNEVFDSQIDTSFLYTIRKNPKIGNMKSNELGISGMTQIREIVDDIQDSTIFIRGSLVWSRIRNTIGEEINPNITFRVAYSE